MSFDASFETKSYAGNPFRCLLGHHYLREPGMKRIREPDLLIIDMNKRTSLPVSAFSAHRLMAARLLAHLG